MSEWIAPVVSIVGAVLSTATFGYGVWKGSRELNKWRVERAGLKRAEVAGETLVAIIQFTGALKVIRSPFFMRSEESFEHAEAVDEYEKREREAKRLSEDLSARWNGFEPISNRFVNAWEQAQVYLPESVSQLMDRVWKLRSRIRASQDTHVRMMRQSHFEQEIYDDAFGAKHDKTLDGMLDEAKDLLRPLAQLSEPKERGWLAMMLGRDHARLGPGH